MKKALATALALSLFTVPALAQEAPPEGAPPMGDHKGPPPGGPHGGPGGPDRFISELDTDKDGKISRSEFQAKGDTMFKEADANGDGYITKEELKAAHEKRREKWEARRAEFKDKRDAKAATGK